MLRIPIQILDETISRKKQKAALNRHFTIAIHRYGNMDIVVHKQQPYNIFKHLKV